MAELLASGRTIVAKVVAIHRVDGMRATPSAEFVLNPRLCRVVGDLLRRRADATRIGGRAATLGSSPLFPTITVVNIADALAIAQQVVDQITRIWFLSGFAILKPERLSWPRACGYALPPGAGSGDP